MLELRDFDRAVGALLDPPLAPAPDMIDLERRVDAIRSRRRRAWLTGAGTACIVVLSLALMAGGGGDRLRTAPPVTRPPDLPATPTTTVAPAGDQPGPRPPVTQPDAPLVGRLPSALPPTTRVPEDPQFADPPDVGCGVSWGGQAPKECTFTAREPGGYRGYGLWTLEITRNGVTTRYEATTAPACADVGLIRPGDSVRLMAYVENGFPGSGLTMEDSWLQAGPAHHC